MKKIIKSWETDIWDNRQDIDPEDTLDWRSLALGYAMGDGYDIDLAEEFFNKLVELDII